MLRVCAYLLVLQWAVVMQSQTPQAVSRWKTSFLDQMTPQELQITANIMYLLYANSVIESKIRQFMTPIARLQQSIRTSINEYRNPAEDLATLKTLIDRLSYVIGTRTVYAKTLATGLAIYGKNPIRIIEDTILALQQDAQIRLRAWADEKASATANLLGDCSAHITECMQPLHDICKLHKGLSEGLLPMELSAEDAANKSLLVLSLILANNQEMLKINESMTNALNDTTDHAAQILHIGNEIYRDYYQALYTTLMSLPCDKQYTMTLFSMYDILPDEYKSALPDADHIFEHALQTTKLYTKTEFLPS